MIRKYISWRRVSTFKQGKSGLGLEAQKEIIRYFVERDNGELVADYSECYTGKELSGCKELRKAMQHAKNIGAVLVIAKSDRFRNCQEALGILDEMGEGNLEFCDLPHSDRFTLTLFWALAEREALITSIRTKQALAVKKAQGAKLGSANEKYIKTMAMKSEKEKKEMFAKRGARKSAKYKEDRDTQVFKKVLQNVFGMPDDTKVWDLSKITLSGDYKYEILAKMKDFKDIDKDTFKNWDLEHLNNHKLYNQLASKVQAFKKSFAREQKQV